MAKIEIQPDNLTVIRNLEVLVDCITKYIEDKDNALILSIKKKSNNIVPDLEGVRSIIPDKMWLNLHGNIRFISQYLTTDTNIQFLISFRNTIVNLIHRITHNNPKQKDTHAKVTSAKNLAYKVAKSKQIIAVFHNYTQLCKDKSEIKLCSDMIDSYSAELATVELALMNMLCEDPNMLKPYVILDIDKAKLTVDYIKILTEFNTKGDN